MATIERIRVNWTGFTGAPGLSTFYATDAITLLPDVRTFFNAIVSLIPNVVTLSFEPFGERFSDVDGSLLGTWSTTTPTPVLGGATALYAAPTGYVVNWITGAVIHNRFLRGKTFIVPGIVSSGDGSPSNSLVTTLQTAATTLKNSAGGLRIWHRPTAPGATDGSSSLVLSAQVPDKAVVLRSRRD
jgi:hypothetical protein